MNNIKKRLDDYVGETPRFTFSLENKIIDEVSTLGGKRNRKNNLFNKLRLSFLFVVCTTVAVTFILSIVINPESYNEVNTITDPNTTPDIPFVDDFEKNMTVVEYLHDGMERGNRDYSAYPIVIDPLAYEGKPVSRGDVIIYDDKFFDGSVGTVVSRVIGLPGENIEIKDGQVYINDQILDTFYGKAHVRGYETFEDYAKVLDQNGADYEADVIKESFFREIEVTVGNDEFLVMTDDWLRGNVKLIKQSDINGQVMGYQKKK
ncbi:signal peptidase I [Cytobacillus solani]|uniref:signal peptidase I n=1 Tax=Cytobacillus solani TaxID=1637975 RepID=UPI0006AB80D6|nr:signal peptidase I [Cytobacillus solani]USK56305.1 signal peptidase I [Cytobacillus solani]